MAAAVLFTDARGRVLVVKPTYKPGWELPGGGVDQDESPRAAATREVLEELGIHRTAGGLLVVDYVPGRRVRSEGLIVVFDGGTLEDTAALRLPADELSEWAFVEPRRLAEYLPARKARRAEAALAAREAATASYLENGRQV